MNIGTMCQSCYAQHMTTKRKTRNVALTVEHDVFVEELVVAGDYQSASEVVRAGLRLLKQDRERQQLELEELRARLRQSLAAEAAGQYVEGTPAEVLGAVFTEAVTKANSRV